MDTKTNYFTLLYFTLLAFVLESNEVMNGHLSNHPSSQLTLIGSDTRAALRLATSTADKTSDLASPSKLRKKIRENQILGSGTSTPTQALFQNPKIQIKMQIQMQILEKVQQKYTNTHVFDNNTA